MWRLRITVMTAATLLTWAALTLSSLAQPPGRGGGFGGRGGGPGGGFGRQGGGFGPGASLLRLASNPAVQEDLKLKDKQKAQIKSLSDKYEERSQAMRAQMGGRPDGGGAGFNGGGGGGGGAGAGQGQDPNAQGGRGRGNRGNRNQNGDGVQEDPTVVAQRNEQRQIAREAMNELRQGAESSLGKILDKGQVARLKQIQLQLYGPTAVLREDIMEKLQIDDAQVAMIREAEGENREVQRANWRSRFEMMKTAYQRINPDAASKTQNGGINKNGGAGGNGGAGDDADANNGRNRGGRGGRGNFNPEAFRKVMEDPQVKAQMEEVQSQDQKLTSQLTMAINKIMTPRQRTMFKKMLGAPFDRSKMGTGGPWGGRSGSQATTKGSATARTSPSEADDDDDTPKAAAAPAKSKPAAAKRKSLRELRGEPGDDN